MKKTVLASSLAVTLGVTGYALTSGHEAHAAETTNYDQLANLAQHNPSELNAHPVKAGAYDFSFVKDGFRYTFTSNGQNFTWKYIYTGEADSQPSTQGYTEGSTQAVSSNAQASNTNVQAVSAPRSSYQTSTTSYSAPATSSSSSSVRLSNGNTAGATGSSAAAIMAQRTGVPASTWSAIIARESNGQANARNASGASGLFQTMPGWGSTATVNDQINAAVRAYKAQGLSAWGM